MKSNATPNVWESTNSHEMETFCGKPYHSQVVGFEEIRSYYETQMIHRVWLIENFIL